MNDSYILLVEARGKGAELTLRAFRKARVANRTEVVHDGIEALEFLGGERSKGDIPALILLDVNLPRMSGIAVLERIRKIETMRYVPIIMIGSAQESLDLRDCYDAGASGYIRKPVSSIKFDQVIQQLCEYWLMTNEVPRGSLRF